MTTPRPPARLTPNLFGVPFGLAGLAGCWSAAHHAAVVAGWPADALWLLAALSWVAVLAPYVRQVLGAGRVGAELADPTFAPFTVVAVIVPMLLAGPLAEVAPTAGHVLFLVALTATVLLGSWVTGNWIVDGVALGHWHPGYILPAAGGGLIAAGVSAALGYGDLARFMLGYGLVCWLTLGSIILLRLFTQPRLAPPLLPTMAIEVAPPAVAGSAWFAINGGRPDVVAFGLAGYTVLMVLVQLRLVPVYRTAPFGPAWWSFAFSYAAAVLLGIRWLAADHVTGQRPLTWLLLAVVTVGTGVLAVRTAVHLSRGTFLPRAVIEVPQPRPGPMVETLTTTEP